jgi:hypothetical protein
MSVKGLFSRGSTRDCSRALTSDHSSEASACEQSRALASAEKASGLPVGECNIDLPVRESGLPAMEYAQTGKTGIKTMDSFSFCDL